MERFAAKLAVALLIQGMAFWAPVGWLAPASVDTSSWLLCYGGGVVYLSLSLWHPKLQLSLGQAAQLVFYAALFAVWFWAANAALDVLGNSVHTDRVPPEARTGLPLHFFLAPGVVSVGLGAMVSARWPATHAAPTRVATPRSDRAAPPAAPGSSRTRHRSAPRSRSSRG